MLGNARYLQRPPCSVAIQIIDFLGEARTSKDQAHLLNNVYWESFYGPPIIEGGQTVPSYTREQIIKDGETFKNRVIYAENYDQIPFPLEYTLKE